MSETKPCVCTRENSLQFAYQFGPETSLTGVSLFEFFVSLNEAKIQPDLADLPPAHILFGPLNAGLHVGIPPDLVTNRSQRVSSLLCTLLYQGFKRTVLFIWSRTCLVKI
jgi:hypothetical protein